MGEDSPPGADELGNGFGQSQKKGPLIHSLYVTRKQVGLASFIASECLLLEGGVGCAALLQVRENSDETEGYRPKREVGNNRQDDFRGKVREGYIFSFLK